MSIYVKTLSGGKVATILNSGAASADSSYNNGFAYDTSGNIQLNTAAVAATASYSNGIARSSDGVLFVNTHDPSLVPYAYLPGVAGNYFSTPNAAANQITGDIDIRATIAPNAWGDGSTNQYVIGKDTGGANRQYAFYLNTAGKPAIFIKANDYVSTAAVAFAAGEKGSIRVTWTSATGIVQFFSSTDEGVNWTQLGNNVAGASGDQTAKTDPVRIGTSNTSGNLLPGKIYRAQIYNGIDGTLAVDFNAADWSETSTNGATQASSTTGEVWTLNNTGADPAMILGVARGQGGFLTDNSGALYVSASDAVSYAVAGIPMTAKNAVAVSAVT